MKLVMNIKSKGELCECSRNDVRGEEESPKSFQLIKSDRENGDEKVSKKSPPLPCIIFGKFYQYSRGGFFDDFKTTS